MNLVLAATSAPLALKIGALVFGAVVGWNAYFINRYRQTVLIGDLATIIGAVGGGAVLTLFPAQSETFGFYGIGLGIGFFGYLALMLVLVAISPQATVNWILGLDSQGHPLEQAPAPAPPAGEKQAPPPADRPFFLRLSKPLKVPIPPL